MEIETESALGIPKSTEGVKSTSIWRTASSPAALGKEGRGGPAPLRAGLPGPRRAGEGLPSPGRGRGGCSDAAGGGEGRQGAGGRTGRKVGAMGLRCASRGSGHCWHPRPGLGRLRAPTHGPSAPACTR